LFSDSLHTAALEPQPGPFMGHRASVLPQSRWK